MISDIKKTHFESQILALFDEATKLCKASENVYNPGGWLILSDLLNQRVAGGVASDPHEFNRQLPK